MMLMLNFIYRVLYPIRRLVRYIEHRQYRHKYEQYEARQPGYVHPHMD